MVVKRAIVCGVVLSTDVFVGAASGHDCAMIVFVGISLLLGALSCFSSRLIATGVSRPCLHGRLRLSVLLVFDIVVMLCVTSHYVRAY